MSEVSALLRRARALEPPSDEDALALAACDDLAALRDAAAAIRDAGHGRVVSYSRKVFIPLTQLCRDSCHYCTFAHPPRSGEAAFLSPEEVLAIARAGAAADCREALFTLGDKPELRYRAAREALARLGHATTLSYLAEMAALVLRETGLLPHLNPGVMEAGDIACLRAVSVSQGLMLETASARLGQRGQPHFGSPDKDPAVRLATIAAAGAASVPFTSGILIGIGETRAERIEALLALRDLHRRFGHLQEIIVQNFRAKPGTRMAQSPEPTLADHLWTIAVARIIFGPAMNIQAPPNLAAGELAEIVASGINDWGGVSPVTRDHVNPERAWPALDELAPRDRICPAKFWSSGLRSIPNMCAMARAGSIRRSGPPCCAHRMPKAFAAPIRGCPAPASTRRPLVHSRRRRDWDIFSIAQRRGGGSARRRSQNSSPRAGAISTRSAMPPMRSAREFAGERVSYVVTRNINYTNICSYRCRFCAFSKGKLADNLRGRPYDLDLAEIARRAVEAWERGAVEVCLQGGIHPEYTGATYLADLPRDQGGGAGAAHPRLLAARSVAGRADAGASGG